ncbi:hypothetical protein HPB49_008739 [Dermacentor silvarum]|uniref:Uncharacterized protein n=1 Tax=Dermacentor silvarum TaxID=543639 RepID=A0ACB8DNV2_DERSI|nr:hypothetical protein HPB49_008739 [Dermacentor silvarum]
MLLATATSEGPHCPSHSSCKREHLKEKLEEVTRCHHTFTEAQKPPGEALVVLLTTACERGQRAEIIVVGDFNAHVENLDGCTDANDRLFLELAESAGLVITNLTEKCCGATTWSTWDRRSCIDYCLMTELMYGGLNNMVVD